MSMVRILSLACYTLFTNHKKMEMITPIWLDDPLYVIERDRSPVTAELCKASIGSDVDRFKHRNRA